MKRTYIIFAVIFTISLLAQIGAMQYLLQTHDTGLAASINRAGKQRMLSQHIAFQLNHLLIEDGAAFGRIRHHLVATIEEMKNEHARLMGQLDQRSAEIQHIYLNEPFALDAKVKEYIRTVTEILNKATSLHAVDPNAEQVEYMNNIAIGTLPETLNIAVFAYQKEAERQAKKTSEIILALSTLVLLTMLLGLLQFILTMRQIRKTEKKLSLSRFVFKHSLDGIITADKTGTITSANPAIRDLLVTETGALVGKNLFSLMHEIEGFENVDGAKIAGILSSKGMWRDEVLNHINQQKNYLSIGIRTVYDSEGKIISYVALLTDISDQKETEEHFKTLSMHDALTGLYNRSALFEAMEHEMHIAKREKTSFAFLMLDLDGFKQINDSFGHQAGDEVLKRITRRLKNTVRESDIVARLGGDEFAIVQRDVDAPTDVEVLADKIIKDISRPINWERDMLNVGCSIGISIYPQHANDIGELTLLADQAMYRIKQSGKNHFAIHWPGKDTDYEDATADDVTRGATPDRKVAAL